MISDKSPQTRAAELEARLIDLLFALLSSPFGCRERLRINILPDSFAQKVDRP